MDNKFIIATSYTLGKNERLKSRKLIAQLFKQGNSLSVFPIRLLYGFFDGNFPLQAAFSVSSKHFKKAVDRNRIKRLMREAYRLQKASVKTTSPLSLFLIYTGKEMPEYKLVNEKMGLVIQSLIKKIHELPAQNN